MARGAVLLAVVLWPAAAGADTTPITNRNFAIDIYQGGVVNGGRTIGMGGANIAAGESAVGMSSNPAAAAARPATSNDTWDWDFNLDWLTPAVGSDFDNNGVPSTETSGLQVWTGALVGQYRQWAVGFSFSQQISVGAADRATAPEFQVGHFDVARAFRDGALIVGAGTRPSHATIAGATITGVGIEAGVLLAPRGERLRVGLTAALPITGDTIDAPTDCDPMNCNGYILPDRIAVPWELGAGVAWRGAATPWNQRVKSRWRDEKSILVGIDVLLTGPVADGAGIEAFLDKQLQPSGRTLSVSVRGGAEYEWRPGRLRVRAGSYWEPGRFEDVGGRLHLTAGLDFRFWQLRLWGAPYRVRLSLTLDGAARYGNGGVSVGLWH